MSVGRFLCCGWLLCLCFPVFTAFAQQPGEAPADGSAPRTVLQTTIRRVVVDVVVTDSKGVPVSGLKKEDFRVSEDGAPQGVLSFDTVGFTPEMDYTPPPLPKQAENTYINLPSGPEKGPLYVLLYDMVDLDDPTQMDTPEDHHQQVIARQQMVKFIQSKPEGTRFAIFSRSDGLHLVQGFTSDKALLMAAIDPRHPRPHMPAVFLMASAYGRGNRLGALDTMYRIAKYLDGLPGRKNLIWFSSMFPLSLYAQPTDGLNFQDETKATLNLMAQNQIAIYPVDARGVATQDSHEMISTEAYSPATSSSNETSPAASAGSALNTVSSGAGSGSVQGQSAVGSSFQVMDAIARETGGQAFYGTNDVAAELVQATVEGGVYYTLTYAPSNREFNGGVRHIEVELTHPGYHLAYRRSYYGTGAPSAAPGAVPQPEVGVKRANYADEPVMDSLSANMQYGAPLAHQLLFVVQARTMSAPAEGTPEEMAQLATEPAFFKLRRRSGPAKPLAPIPLQRDGFSFEIPKRQFQGETSLDLEVAIAAYDAEGQLMNAVVRLAKQDLPAGPEASATSRFYRIDQELEVPVAATTLRFAVRDTANNRVGAMEIALPLHQSTEAPRSTGEAH
jgi:VWFA-related protein